MPIHKAVQAIILKRKYSEWKQGRELTHQPGFFPIWSDFAQLLPYLDPGAVKLYVYLGICSKNQTGESWHSLKQLSKALNASERTVQMWLRSLKEAGLIDRLQHKFNGPAVTYLRPYNPHSAKKAFLRKSTVSTSVKRMDVDDSKII